MADTVEKILLSLNLDTDQITANLQKAMESSRQLKAEQASLQKQMKDLEKAGQTGSASYAELSKKLIENKTASGILRTEQKNLENQLSLNAKALKAEEGSYEQLLRVQQLAQIELKNMSGSIKLNADGTAQLTQENKAAQERVAQLKNTIISFDQSIKDGRTNVGNYSDSFKDAINSTGLFGGTIGKARTIVNGFLPVLNQTQASLKNYVSSQKESVDATVDQVKVESEKTRTVVEGFAATKSSQAATDADTASKGANTTATTASTVATGGLSTALKVLKVALISTGIGAIVVALGSLITFLTQTQRGMDAVSKVTTAVGAAFSVIIDRVSAFGEGISKIFSGDFTGGATAIKNSVKGIGEEIVKETKAAYDLKGALNSLEDAEIEYITTKAESEKKLEELKTKSKIQTLDIETRRQATKDAIKLEEEILDKELAFAKERARISQEQTDLGESTREEIKANAELQAEVFRRETQTIARKKELLTELSGFEKQISDKETAERNAASKAKEDALNKELEANKKFYEANLKAKNEFDKAEIDLEKSKLELKKQAAQSITNPTELFTAQLDILNQTFELEIREIDRQKTERIRLKQQEIDEGVISAQAGIDAIKQIEEQADVDKLIQYQKSANEIAAFVSKTDQENIKRLVEQRERELQVKIEQKQLELEVSNPTEELDRKLELLALEHQAEVQRANDSIKNEEERQKKIAGLTKKYELQKSQIISTAQANNLNAISGVLDKVGGMLRRDSKAFKAIAISKAIINTYLGAARAFADYKYPISLAIAAAEIASGFAQVNQIRNTKEYRQGGYTGDGNPDHVSYALGKKSYTYHKREYVIPDGVLSNPMVGNYVSSVIEPMRRGIYPVSSTRGYITGGFADSSAVSSSAQSTANLAGDIVGSIMRNLPPIYTIVQDVTEAQGVAAQVIDRANI